MGHTEGKWKRKRHETQLLVKSSHDTGINEIVCYLYIGNPCNEADANLIAAAPELLKGCKMSLDFLLKNEPKKKTGKSILHAQALYHTLESAIAEAEGK